MSLTKQSMAPAGFGHAVGREAANELGQQRRYLILIGRRDEPRLLFECMAPSSGVAWNRHVHLCRPLERCEVRAVQS